MKVTFPPVSWLTIVKLHCDYFISEKKWRYIMLDFLGFLEKEIKKDEIPMLDTGDNPDAPAPREMIDLEVKSKNYTYPLIVYFAGEYVKYDSASNMFINNHVENIDATLYVVRDREFSKAITRSFCV